MKSMTLKIDVGDTIEVGRFRNVATKIKDINPTIKRFINFL